MVNPNPVPPDRRTCGSSACVNESDTEQLLVRLIRVRANRISYLTGLSELDRISHEIDDDLPQSPLVCADEAGNSRPVITQ
jgi:hypothetical protein